MTDFDARLDAATTPEEAWRALQDLAQSTVGARLFTVTVLDMDAMLARRAYSSDEASYPAAGTKPITRNAFFDRIHGEGKPFVANTLEEMGFPDIDLIGSLGCGSVVNLPIVHDGDLVATMNILHEAGHYTPERVARTVDDLTAPARAAYVRARSLGPLL